MMPGDLGDARLLNYFLESNYQFFLGRIDSLWSPAFFYPYPFVLGFSENLIGTSPLYSLSRIFGCDADTAYQVWFYLGYFFNYSATYYALRKLGFSIVASSFGALVFAFSLPTTAHAGHAQLHYRFGVPLVILFLINFINTKSWRFLIISGFFLAWQFYSGIYIGFFTLLFCVIILVIYFINQIFSDGQPPSSIFQAFRSTWASQESNKKIKYTCSIILLVFSMLLLFYPYIFASNIYGFTRNWFEISSMLPRPQSYFLSDASQIWSFPSSKVFADLPMRHEHQMFIGFIPILLAIIGGITASRTKNGLNYILMAGGLLGSIILTLNIYDFSLWYFFHKLPLVSAIRGVTRIDQVLLFPVAYLIAIAIDNLRTIYIWGNKFIILLVIPFFLAEISMTSMPVTPKEVWRHRDAAADKKIPANLPKDPIIFMANISGPFYANDLDSMWASLRHGYKTLNGYSGNYPPGFNPTYGVDCAEIPRRIISYLQFIGQENSIDNYLEIYNRVVPIGFLNCDVGWSKNMPSISFNNRQYTNEEMSHISLQLFVNNELSEMTQVTVRIINSGDLIFASRSAIGKPLRISWRFLDANGIPLSGWDNRKDLPMDIPANGHLDLVLTVKKPIDSNQKVLQVSIVQELVAWGHDIGITPAIISLK